jgi:hypothetical protein
MGPWMKRTIRRSRSCAKSRLKRSSGGVLRLRNLAMNENIRRAEDPAWRDVLAQQVMAAQGFQISSTWYSPSVTRMIETGFGGTMVSRV